MRINLWQRRQGLRPPPSDLVYVEDGATQFPLAFRNRVLYWAVDALGALERSTTMGEVVNPVEMSWERLYQALCAAYGRTPLVPLERRGPDGSPTGSEGRKQLPTHVHSCPDIEVIDLVDAVFQISNGLINEYGGADPETESARLGGAINEILEQEGIGYRWVEGEIVRFDDPITHREAVEPALELLSGGEYGAANQEFRDAVADYRRGAWRSAITHANAAFESTLKVITGETSLEAGPLIRKAREQGALPGYSETSADNLVKLMNGLPAIRGQEGSAHGAGGRESEADQALARLALTMAAAFIVFLDDRGTSD